VTVWLKTTQRPEFVALAKLLTTSDLSVVSVTIQDAKTGRMRGVKLGPCVESNGALAGLSGGEGPLR
jgi:hypothetical protein